MKVVILACLVALAVAESGFEPITRFYHESVGIEAAARIKAAEAASDFDGNRIAGGGPTQVGTYPHFGGLLISLESGHQSVCGSSLLSNTRLVTAAHCWYDGHNQATEFEVVFASLTLFTGGTRVVTSDVVLHENWRPEDGLANDVAIIRIPFLAYTPNIRRIDLPEGMLLQNTFTGFNAQAVGFGRHGDHHDITQAQTLHHVALRVISNSVCQQTFGPAIIPSTICTDGSEGRSTCGGDSGGPLSVMLGWGTFYEPTLIGITSFGAAAGCERAFPAAFTRVTSYNSWIRLRLIL